MEYNLFKDNIVVTMTIIICIALVSTIYIGIGLFVNYMMDEHYYEVEHKQFDENYVKNTNSVMLILNMAYTFSTLMIIAFLIKNVFDIVIAPNIDIVKYKNIYELYTGSVLMIVLVTFSQVLNKQYKDIKLKLAGYIY